MKGLAEREGFESALESKFNDMQGHGWHRSTWNSMACPQTDRERIAIVVRLFQPCPRINYFNVITIGPSIF